MKSFIAELFGIIRWYFIDFIKIPFRLIRDIYRACRDKRMDVCRNISTCGEEALSDETGRYGDADIYGTLSYNEIRQMLDYLRLGKKDVALDLGCGKGRVLFELASSGIQRVKGVEIQKKLADQAAQNLKRLPMGASPFEIFHSDAADYAFYDETFVFMLNPFGLKTLTRVIENINKSLIQNPRTVRIAYYGRHRDYISINPSFEYIGEIGKTQIHVWKNR